MTTAATSAVTIDPAHAALMFPHLTPAQIARVAAHGTARPLRSGDVLVEAGAQPVPFFVIRSGQVEVVRVSGDGEQLVVTHGPGSVSYTHLTLPTILRV